MALPSTAASSMADMTALVSEGGASRRAGTRPGPGPAHNTDGTHTCMARA